MSVDREADYPKTHWLLTCVFKALLCDTWASAMRRSREKWGGTDCLQHFRTCRFRTWKDFSNQAV